MAYNKTNWRDTIKDNDGNIIEKGTPLASTNLNKMEDGIANATEKAEKAEGDLVKVSQQLADKADKDEVRPETTTNPITMAELHTEVKTAMTGGSVPVVDVDAVGSENLKIKSVTPEKTSFLSLKELNLFNKDDPENVDGMIDTLTGLSPLAGYFVSHYIPVKPGKTYQRPNNDSSYLYDANKQYKRRIVSSVGSTFQVQEGEAFIRLNMPIGIKNTAMFAEAPLPSTYQPFGSIDVSSREIETLIQKKMPKELGVFSSWNVIGDSLTDESNPASTFKYWNKVSEWLDIPQVNDYGSSGSCVGFIEGVFTNPMSERYSSMADADLITAFGGVNDYGKNIPLGTMSDRTNTTFYGALHVLLRGLITKYPTKKIGYIIFHKFGAGWNPTKNSLDLTPKQYVNAIKEVCSYYAIPYLNLFEESGLFLSDSAQQSHYTTDGLHFNDIGQEYIADLIYKWIKYKM